MDAPRPTSELAADIAAGIEANLDGAQARAKARLAHEALVARITDLEAQVAKGWDEVVAEDKARAIRAEIRAEAAEAQVAALTQERDDLTEPGSPDGMDGTDGVTTPVRQHGTAVPVSERKAAQ